MTDDIKIFKLNYSGSLENVSEEIILKSFTLFDILNFYIPNKRLMYIWISKKAPQSLKGHIPSIRETLVREYPNLKILRNITVEFGSEPREFFSDIMISEKKYKDFLSELEIKLLPVLSEINRLKDEADKAFISENYEDSIKFSQKILELAKEIDDNSLKANQLNFIEEAKSRAEAKKFIQEIENEAKIKLQIFNNLNKAKNYKEAHKIVVGFRKKYENDFNLFSIPLAQEILLKDENMIYNLKQEQDLLIKKFNEKQINLENLIKNNKLNQAKIALEQVKDLIAKIINNQISKKWELLKNNYLNIKQKKKNEIKELNKNALIFLNQEKLLKSIEIFDEIIDKLEHFIE